MAAKAGNNYRPIFNLNFISKVLERLFLSRFQRHILDSPNFNRYQSAYRPGCSTETALQLLLDRISSASDKGKPMLLVSLDLSAAFDMVDHATLLKRLSCSCGVSGVVHSLIKSYRFGRTQSVRNCDSVLCWCASRIRPGATTSFLFI